MTFYQPPYCAGEHRWPRGNPGGSRRSVGDVTYEQCNNCLALRITQEWIVKDESGAWVIEGTRTLLANGRAEVEIIPPRPI